MKTRERVQLLGGPYQAPALRRGDRTMCLYRDCEVYVTSWTDARISWPRCKVRGQRGGTGLLVNDELLRAIRTESAKALKHWFGVSAYTIWSWRQSFDVERWGTEGSRRLLQGNSEAGARKLRGKRVPSSVIRQRSQTRKARGYKGSKRWEKNGWTAADLGLLGTVPDEDLARQLGRTVKAVTVKRGKRGIPSARDRRRKHQP